MRFEVCKEGIEDHPNGPRRFIEHGSMKSEERVPVVFNYYHEGIVGWATDFQRSEPDEDGSVAITYEITFTESKWEEMVKDYNPPRIWANQLDERKQDDGLFHVYEAYIREVSFLIHGANPGAEITTKAKKI